MSGVRRAAALALDVLIVFTLVVLAVIVFLGGGVITIGVAEISFTNTRNPATVLLLLIGLRRWVRGPGGHSPPLRRILALGSRLHGFAAARPRRATRLVLVVAALYALGMSAITIGRHESFASHAFDLGIFDQLLWSAANGHGLTSSILARPFFAEHFSPVLWAVSALYRVTPDVRVLLVFQTMALAVGAVATAGIARTVLGSATAGLGFAIVYTLYVPMRNVNLYDFHPVALATPLLLLAIWAMEARRWGTFTVLALLTLTCKEELGFAVAALGVWIALSHRKRALGSTLAVVGMAWVVATTIWIIPAFRGGDFAFVHRYAYLGDSIGEILASLLTRPDLVFTNLLDGKKLQYFLEVFGPLGLISFASPAALLAMPTFLQNVLSNAPAQYSVAFQYTAPLTPFVFHSAIRGCQAIRAAARGGLRGPATWIPYHRVPVLVAAGSLVFLASSPAHHLRKYRPDDGHRRLASRLGEIPLDASVSAQDTLVPHLSQRGHIREFPDGERAQYVVLDLGAKTWPLAREDYEARVTALLGGTAYGVAVHDPPLLVLERGAPADGNAAVSLP